MFPSGGERRTIHAQVKEDERLMTFTVEIEEEEDGRWIAEVFVFASHDYEESVLGCLLESVEGQDSGQHTPLQPPATFGACSVSVWR